MLYLLQTNRFVLYFEFRCQGRSQCWRGNYHKNISFHIFNSLHWFFLFCNIQYTMPLVSNSFFFKGVTENDVLLIISNSKNNTSMELDCVSTKILKILCRIHFRKFFTSHDYLTQSCGNSRIKNLNKYTTLNCLFLIVC